jgi:hypothetical protein
MKVIDFNCVFAVTMLTLGSGAMADASILSASLNNPVSPLGNVITPVNFSGPVGSSPIFGLGFEVDFSTAPNQGVVKGSSVGNYAAPVAGTTAGAPLYLTGNYGSPLTSSVDDSGDYLSTGLGSITITFAAPQTSFVILWGSVDQGNKLTFNDTAKDTVTGTDVQQATAGFVADGYQGYGGSAYVMVNTATPFTSITASSTSGSFEFLAEAGATVPPSLSSADPLATPEPYDMLLLGSGLIVIAFIGLRKAGKSKAD